MGRGRDADADRPVEPDEARVHGNDPDAVESDAGREAGGVAAADAQEGWNVPSRVLPPIGSQDLPEPIPLGKIIGASVVILATALGSGELIIWPYITTQIGIAFLWLAVVGFFMQFVINMEIERYTLATGETAVTGFTRFWKPWGIIFVLGAVLPNAFPGWATGGATLFTYLFGFGDPAIIATIVLVATALALTLSPVVYQALEKIQMVLVGIIMIFLVVGYIRRHRCGGLGEHRH